MSHARAERHAEELSAELGGAVVYIMVAYPDGATAHTITGRTSKEKARSMLDMLRGMTSRYIKRLHVERQRMEN